MIKESSKNNVYPSIFTERARVGQNKKRIFRGGLKQSSFIIISFFFITTGVAQTQENVEMWVKLSPEIRMNFEKLPLEIRLRPDDHIFLPEKYVPSGNQARIDFMLGFNFWKFKLFSYTKYDESEAFWTGARLDFNFTALNKKLLVNIQERYFWGLNEDSEEHYYLVQYIRYRISSSSGLGVLSYGKWRTDRDFDQGYWFIGPSIEMGEKSGFSLLLAFTKDIFHEPVYMTFVRIGYKFKIEKKSKFISIDTEAD